MDIDNKYGLLECHQNLLKLLEIFDKMCIENEIVYGADSGTLLGAIRHDGFIPWDDDIDVVLNRENYDKLIRLDLSKYGLKRVRKVWIESLVFIDESYTTKPILDLFILDNTPNNQIMKSVKLFCLMCIHGLWHHYMPQNNNNRKILYRLYSFVFGNLGRFFTDEQIFRMFQYISKIGNNSSSEFVQCYNYLTSELHVLYPKWIMDRVIRHKFESIDINIPKDYQTYLTNLYGDYMTPVKTK